MSYGFTPLLHPLRMAPWTDVQVVQQGTNCIFINTIIITQISLDSNPRLSSYSMHIPFHWTKVLSSFTALTFPLTSLTSCSSLLGGRGYRKREDAKLHEMLHLGSDCAVCGCGSDAEMLVKLFCRKVCIEISLRSIAGSSILPKSKDAYHICKCSKMIIIIFWSRFTISFHWLIIFYHKKTPFYIFVLSFMYRMAYEMIQYLI
jgi:hypothetical protein